MQLPNGEHAVVPLEKLLDYCLNPDHPRGRHKARVFASALRITAADASELQHAILAAAATEEAVATEKDDYGQRYMLDFELQGPHGLAVVRTLWIVLQGEAHPRMTSCFVL